MHDSRVFLRTSWLAQWSAEVRVTDIARTPEVARHPRYETLCQPPRTLSNIRPAAYVSVRYNQSTLLFEVNRGVF